MDKIELNIVALAQNESQNNSFVVILKEGEGNRRLPIVIGGFEAQAIAIALEGIRPNRPMTHDLFRNTLAALEVELQEIVISDLREGIFYATMVCLRSDGRVVEMDARTSDAIALAVRFGCPIYTFTFIMDRAGITWGEEPLAPPKPPVKDAALSEYSEEDLLKMLDTSIEQEDYEKAAAIRDELKKRQEG